MSHIIYKIVLYDRKFFLSENYKNGINKNGNQKGLSEKRGRLFLFFLLTGIVDPITGRLQLLDDLGVELEHFVGQRKERGEDAKRDFRVAAR